MQVRGNLMPENPTSTPKTSAGKTTILGTERYNLESAIVEQNYTIDIARPPFPISEGSKLPVIVVLDGDMSFPGVAQTAKALQIEPDGLPPVLVVGIGYEAAGESAVARHMEYRIRDYTPSVDEHFMKRMQSAPPPLGIGPDIEAGGAGLFSSFLMKELFPYLETNFHADATDRTLIGVSLGGLFALHTLLSSPRSFQRYVAVSPSLWWDNVVLDRYEKRFIGVNSKVDVNVFLSVGALEEKQDPDAKMVSNLHKFASQLGLNADSGLKIDHMVFPDETHMSCVPGAISRGLRSVFEIVQSKSDK